MPAPYSYDLRGKAIEAVRSGERKISIIEKTILMATVKLDNASMPSNRASAPNESVGLQP
jgi:hypothetical protein